MRKRIGRWKIRRSARRTSKPRPSHQRQEREGRLRVLKSSSTRAVMYFHEGKGQPGRLMAEIEPRITRMTRMKKAGDSLSGIRVIRGETLNLRPASARKAYPA